MSFDFVEYIVPAAFLWYAYSLLVQKPAFGDTRRGFPTRRAREKKEIWDYVQRCAGIVCVIMGVLQIAVTLLCNTVFAGQSAYYWLQFGLKGFGIVAIFPIVIFITNCKFPKAKTAGAKKGGKK